MPIASKENELTNHFKTFEIYVHVCQITVCRNLATANSRDAS